MPRRLTIKALMTFLAIGAILTSAAITLAGTTTYIYDELDRLKEVQFGDGNGIRYEYDEIGNLKSKTPTGNVFSIAATADNGGGISPTGTVIITAGSSRTYSIFSLYGYQIGNVYVDNNSQGAISSYTFSNITANHTINASFVLSSACASPPVRIPRATPAYFSTLQAAYNAAVSGETIQAQTRIMVENFAANRPITVTLDGGYSCDYGSNPDKTIIKGMPRTSSGTVTMKNFRITN